jgi:hypothetical protein
MNVALTAPESAAIRKALRTYLSDLRVEIVDTDNAQYKRELRDERELLESAIGKLDGGLDGGSAATGGDGEFTEETVRVVQMWWAAR